MTTILDVKCVIVKSDTLSDWWLIERAEHDHKGWMEEIGPNCDAFGWSGRIGDADIEGTSSEMIAIAEAIERHGSTSFKRCAVRFIPASEGVFGSVPAGFMIYSPRNTTEHVTIAYERARELAADIRAKVRP